jgi:hypothetical protein
MKAMIRAMRAARVVRAARATMRAATSARVASAADLSGRVLAAAVCLVLAAAGAVRVAGAVPLGGTTPGGGEAGCPAAITARQAATAPAGWEVSYDKTANNLAAVTFFDGPPAEQASLVYDEQTSRAGETRAVWRFTGGGKGIWIFCAYDGTRAVLSRRLPAAVRTCTVRYEKAATSAAGLPAIKGIDCR